MGIRFHDYLELIPRKQHTPEEEKALKGLYERLRKFCKDKKITVITAKAPPL